MCREEQKTENPPRGRWVSALLLGMVGIQIKENGFRGACQNRFWQV